jgi:hypothetical protein
VNDTSQARLARRVAIQNREPVVAWLQPPHTHRQAANDELIKSIVATKSDVPTENYVFCVTVPFHFPRSLELTTVDVGVSFPLEVSSTACFGGTATAAKTENSAGCWIFRFWFLELV